MKLMCNENIEIPDPRRLEAAARPGRAGLAAALLLLLLAPVLPAAADMEQEPPTAAEYRHFAVATENLPVEIDLRPALAAAGADPGALVHLVEAPFHGELALGARRLVYAPEEGFFGRDRVRLTAGGRTFSVELRVLPRYLPFSGRYQVGGDLTLGVYDNLSSSFLFCLEPGREARSAPRDCVWREVSGIEGRSLIPLSWWADKNGRERPSLYDLASGELFFLEERSAGKLRAVAVWSSGEPGGWPVMGDWQGGGQVSLALVFESGRVLMPDTGIEFKWTAVLSTHQLEDLLWPLRLSRREGGPDRLALADAKWGDLHLFEADPDGLGIEGFLPSYGAVSSDYRRPLGFLATYPARPGLPAILFLQTGSQGIELVTGSYEPGHPSTIPIKFPDDPPAGGHHAGQPAAVEPTAGEPAATEPTATAAVAVIEQPLPVPERRSLVLATEGQPATFDLDAAGAAGSLAEIDEAPVLGGWQLDQNLFYYFPAPGQFGSDRILASAGAALIRLEVRLLPRFLPFAGQLKPNATSLGVYDNASQRFLLCTEPSAADPEVPRDCLWSPVRGLRTVRSLVPVAWPADKSGAECAALYDMATGELLKLAWNSTFTFLQATEVLHFGDAGIGGWPVVGQWRAAEEPEMAFVFADGRVSLPASGREIAWPAVLAAETLHLLSPLRLPAADGGRDRLALVDPKSGAIDWLEPDFEGGGGLAGFEPHHGSASDFRRPLAFVSRLPLIGGILPTFSFLQQAADGALVLVPGQYLIAKPQTIPIKFPDDPPSG